MDQLVNFIIRPPRAEYSAKDDLLDQEFMLKGRWFQRKDLEVINGRGNKLKCSHYVPLGIPEGKTLPCVIYCHGNSGCRADASEAAIILLPSNITVFTLDFSGSGLSEGEHVTLGWNEKDDLKAVVNYLRTDGNVSCIGLWGRSMGAVTSLMYGTEDPSIAGMVLDSPFSNLVDLMMELVDTYKYPLPKFTVKFAIQHMRKVIKKKANFDIMDLDTIQVAKCCFVPALLGHATDDDFIRPHHSDRIYDCYAGDKNIIKFDGDHNSPRPQFYFDSITIFFHNVLNPPKDVFHEHYSRVVHGLFTKDHWDTMHEAGYRVQSVAEQSSELAASSQEDALTQLRSRRPMSRTEVPPDISPQGKQFGAELQENGGECDHNPSSSGQSGMDHPNDYWRSNLIPSITDDEYVEYSFDGLPDIPCSMEDEERMFMEAVIESLRDLELKNSQEEDGRLTSSLDSSDSMKAPTTGTNGPSAAGSSMSASTGSVVNLDPALDASGSCTTDSASTKDSASSDAASNSASSTVDCSSSTQGADMVAGTRARLVVQKGPASHIIDGLTHRWGLNFFKNR